jgi:LacI family transcriptional regulator, galactose operon repressor
MEPETALQPPSRATIADVAQRAGVSIATVSRVVNRTGPVAEETATHVQAAIAELNYVPHAAARGLASRHTNTLGLLVAGISSPFLIPLLRGIEIGAHEAGFSLLIHSTHEGASHVPRARRPLGEHNTDGLLVYVSTLDETDLRYFYDLHFPMVLLYQTPPDSLPIPHVNFENKTGARNLVDHLIEVHGYRRIAFLKGPEDEEDSYWRERGYLEALAAHSLPFDPALMGVGGFNEELAQHSVEKWLEEGMSMDAIFAGDDDAAVGVIRALQQAGKNVPQDVAVVGFDDVHLAHYLMPPLTTVRTPVEQSGHEAVRQLVQLIQTGHAEQHILLPTELVVRRSCGCEGG